MESEMQARTAFHQVGLAGAGSMDPLAGAVPGQL